ncbi:MAG: alcohol dehydrogenase catalytic domain-containing protein [Planctomycetota bacterium]|nr:alcohol dehydrogenase catalytic domain-containing protein [Planctomycetota bacterium]
MRAAVLHGKEDVRVETMPVPRPAAGELLLKIGAALTCGTDLKVFRRGYHAAMIKPPSVFGHECAGTVAAVGDGARFAPGDRVVVANSAPCGTCYFCARAQENLCEDLQFLNGAYAEYLRVPERFVRKNAYAVPAGLPFEHAAMTEPLACVVHGLDETAPKAGERVAVIGLGPIGLMFVALLRERGCRVAGVGRHAPRLDLARKLGAETVLEADANGAWMEQMRQGERLDVVIEATGLPEVWAQAIGLVRRGGRVNLFGGCPDGTTVALDTKRMHYDQITLFSSFHHRPADIQAALGAIARGTVKPADFITEEHALDALPGLFAEMLRTKRQVKACIRP